MDALYTPERTLTRTKRLCFVTLIAMAAVITSTTTTPVSANPRTWVVTTTDDDPNVPGDVGCPASETRECTLRAAIGEAGDGDVIELGPETYELHEDEGEIEIAHAIRITGDGRDDTVIEPSSNGYRIFQISASSGQVVLEHMTLRGGGSEAPVLPGGAIWISASTTVRLDDIRLSDNDNLTGTGNIGGALYVGPVTVDLSITNSELSQNLATEGGAIALFQTDGSVEITGSSFSGNESDNPGGGGTGHGAAIYLNAVEASVLVSNTSFDGNEASRTGGAIAAFGSAPIIVRSSTFSNNSAGTGGTVSLQSGASIDARNSTFVANTGGVLRTDGNGNVADLSFLTIVQHDPGFDVNAADDVALRHSALSDVDGCDDVDTDGNVSDDASSADCSSASETYPTVALTTAVDGVHYFPEHDSPLSGRDIDGCPDSDQRGVDRSGTCTVGAIDPAEITCPTGELPRDQQIECTLDVGLTGSPTVTVELNPTLFSDNVTLNDGAGSFSFSIPGGEPNTTVVVSVDGGKYSSSHPVEPTSGSGGGAGDGGSSGGSGNGDDDPEGTEHTGDGSIAAIDEPSTTPEMLPVTGAETRRQRTVAITLVAIGVMLAGTTARRTRSAHDDC